MAATAIFDVSDCPVLASSSPITGPPPRALRRGSCGHHPAPRRVGPGRIERRRRIAGVGLTEPYHPFAATAHGDGRLGRRPTASSPPTAAPVSRPATARPPGGRLSRFPIPLGPWVERLPRERGVNRCTRRLPRRSKALSAHEPAPPTGAPARNSTRPAADPAGLVFREDPKQNRRESRRFARGKPPEPQPVSESSQG